MDGPKGNLKYTGYGIFTHMNKMGAKKKRLGLLAAGTGLNPLYSIAQASVLAKDGFEISMVCSNKTPDDIILKAELDALVHHGEGRFKVHHTLTRHEEKIHGKREGLFGRITQEMLQEIKFPLRADKDTMILVCGPKAFETSMV